MYEHNQDDPRDVVIGILLFVDLFLVICLLTGCGPSRSAPIRPPVVYKTTYSYWQDSPNNFVVYLPNVQAERDAKFDLCSSAYVCQIAPVGKIVKIERVRK